MYVKERLQRLNPGRFIEIGIGQGQLSNLILNLGWTGIGFDLNSDTLQVAKKINENYIKAGQYSVQKQDWLASKSKSKVDLVISSMVLEHLKPNEEKKFFQKALQQLKPGGILIILVPSNPDAWGIDDEIAGHYRRYTLDELKTKSIKNNFNVLHLVGLTFPLANMTLPISQYLVEKAEKQKQKLSMLEKTKLSGNRNVLYKTAYPKIFGLVLNEFFLSPFYWVQKLNSKNEKSLIIYAELSPRRKK